MPDHYFVPHLEFAPKDDPTWIARAISEWENEGGDGPRVLGTNGRALPAFPPLEPGTVEHRWGTFADGSGHQYRLRLEVVGARRRVRIGLLLSGPDVPGSDTRGGGELVERLLANWKHMPAPATFPTRLRELTTSKGVRELFEHMLAVGRKIPILVVTRRSRGEEQVADPERLAEYLWGMAEVWSLPKATSTFELGQEFVSRGFDKRWNCYDGGVRLYLPGLDPATDTLGRHPLVLATRLLMHDDPTIGAASWALGAVARALGVDEWKARWREELAGRGASPDDGAKLADLEGLRLLRLKVGAQADSSISELAHESDDALETENASVDSNDETPDALVASAPSVAPAAAVPEVVDSDASPSSPTVETDSEPGTPDEAIVSPSTAPAVTTSVSPRPTRIQRGLSSLREAFNAFADLEGLLEELEGELAGLRDERDAIALDRDELSQALQDLEQERDGFDVPTTVEGVLMLFEGIGGDALRVTAYARRKAASSKFSDTRLLGRVLSILVAVGPDFGAVHATLESSLGRRARAKPKESKQTMAKFGQHRTFPVGDQVVEVEQHITLGHGKRNLNETLHVYWRRAPDGVTEIVYAGEHLPTVSGNT